MGKQAVKRIVERSREQDSYAAPTLWRVYKCVAHQAPRGLFDRNVSMFVQFCRRERDDSAMENFVDHLNASVTNPMLSDVLSRESNGK